MTTFGPLALTGGVNAVTVPEYPHSPLLGAVGEEISFDLATQAAGGIEFIAPADGRLSLVLTGGGNGRTLFVNVARMVQA